MHCGCSDKQTIYMYLINTRYIYNSDGCTVHRYMYKYVASAQTPHTKCIIYNKKSIMHAEFVQSWLCNIIRYFKVQFFSTVNFIISNKFTFMFKMLAYIN